MQSRSELNLDQNPSLLKQEETFFSLKCHGRRLSLCDRRFRMLFLSPIKRENHFVTEDDAVFFVSMKDGRKWEPVSGLSKQFVIVQMMFKSLFWPAKVFSRSCDISSSETFPSSLTFGALISCQSIENDWDAFNSLKILFFIERKSKAKILGRDTWKLMIEILDTVDRYILKKWNVTFVYFLVLNWREIYIFFVRYLSNIFFYSR